MYGIKLSHILFALAFVIKGCSSQLLEFVGSTANGNEGRLVVIPIQNKNSSSVEAQITTSGTASLGSDYTFYSGLVNITVPANSVQNILMLITDDNIGEKDETVVLTLHNGVVGKTVFTVTIKDDDVTLTCATTPAREDSGDLSMTITRTGAINTVANNLTCSIIYDGNAIMGKDINSQLVQENFVFSKHLTVKTFRVPVLHNSDSTDDRIFQISCYTTDVRHVSLPSCQRVQAKILNVDAGAKFCNQNLNNVKTVAENIGQFGVEICRDGSVLQVSWIEVCVGKESIPDGPRAFPSIKPKCKRVTFQISEKKQNATFDVVDDKYTEQKTSTFEIRFGDPKSGDITRHGIKDFKAKLIDDDINTYCIKEKTKTVQEYITPLQVTIERFGNTTKESQITLFSTNGTAKSGLDFKEVNEVVVFKATETEKLVNISIINDNLKESDESFTLGLKGGIAYPDCSTSTITIKSEDAVITCSPMTQTYFENQGVFKYEIKRAGGSLRYPHAVRVVTESNTATANEDFSSVNDTFTFKDGEDTITINIKIFADNVVDSKSSESFYILNSQQSAGISLFGCVPKATFGIIDMDSFIFFCQPLQKTVKENAGQYEIRVCRKTLNPTVAQTIELCWTSDGNGKPNDYPSITAGCANVTFKANLSSVQAAHLIKITDDNWGEQENKTFTVSMRNFGPSKATFNDTANYTVTLQDDDNSFCLKKKTSTVYEQTDSTVVFTIVRTGVVSSRSAVLISTHDQTATGGEDFGAFTNEKIFFNPGHTEKQVETRIKDDEIVENDEDFRVTLSGFGVSTVFPSCNSSTVTIISNDVNISCQWSKYDVFENEKRVLLTMTRTGATQRYNHSIKVQTHDSSAKSGKDYTPMDKTFYFKPTLTKISNISIAITDDKIVEGTENFNVLITTSDKRVQSQCKENRTITIQDDDTYINFCKPLKTSVVEKAGKYQLSLCREGRTTVSHSVKLCWTTDANGRPHDVPSVTAGCVNKTFTQGQKSILHSIKITDDNWGEQENKTFQVSITNIESTVFFNDISNYTVTLHDDDNSFCLKKMAYNVTEQKHKDINILIQRFGTISTTNASVRPVASPDQAISPEDYEFPNNNKPLIFLKKETEKQITIKIKDDKLKEGHEMFMFSLYGVSGSTVFPSCNSSKATIVSNDVDIRCNNLNMAIQQAFEKEGPFDVEITREGSIQYNHTIRIRTVAGSAKNNSDYIPIDKVVTFLAGERRFKFNVSFVNDLIVENDEDFHLELTSTDPRVNVICKRINYVIQNDDTMVTCRNTTLSVSEDAGQVTFQLLRKGYLNKTSPMWYSTFDGTAWDKADYVPANRKNATFHHGENSTTLSIEIVNDDVKEQEELFYVFIGSNDTSTTPISSTLCMNITIKDEDKDDKDDRLSAKQAQEMLESRQRITHLLIAGIGTACAIVLILIIVLLVVCFVM